MSELLFEIFSEEIPARMQVRAGQDLLKAMDAGLKAAGLSPKDSDVMTGPRRLTYVTDVALRSPDVSEERKGPRVGAPERALEGFMRGAGITDIAQAETRSDKKGDYYVAVIQSDGRDTADILRDLIPDVMANFSWPKSMKSGGSDFRWVRPLRGLTVLLAGQSLDDITVGGITSDAIVHGHRQMGPGPFTVSSLADYREKLTGEGHVMIDRDARSVRVMEQAKAVCADAGLELVEDEGLLDEVTGLVEWPVALLGDMDPAFLELPDEVIRLTLRSHQKTFTVRGTDGKLAPNFVIIANLETADDGATIKAGNAKVISARLSDAKFFQEQDRQKKLIDYYDQLDQVVFHKKLGSVRDKADRVAALAREIAPHVGADPEKAEQAAKLAKCDLVTQTVIEATSLQGQVGRWMYEAEGGDADIAVAIEDHYKPQGPSDEVPTNPVAVAVALADKFDSLIGFLAFGEKPTGSKDPFALRRAALGIVRITISQEISKVVYIELIKLVVSKVIESITSGRVSDVVRNSLVVGYPALLVRNLSEFQFETAKLMASDFKGAGFQKNTYSIMAPYNEQTWLKSDHEFILFDAPTSTPRICVQAEIETDIRFYLEAPKDVEAGVRDFLLDRLRVYLRDQGQRHDVIDAVIAQGGDGLLAISQRVEALGGFLSDADGENLVQGYKRAANILRAEQKKGELELAAFETLSGFTAKPAETLANALKDTRPAIDKALQSSDYPAALSALANLREPIDAFFENVVVNSDDADERARRLALLSAVVDTFHRIADFSRLDG